MPSSPDPNPAVEPVEAPPKSPATGEDTAEATAPPTPRRAGGTGSRKRRTTAGPSPRPRYSPAVLMVSVVRLLRAQGLAVSETYEHGIEAMQACRELLRQLDVEPDISALRPPDDHEPVIVAATVLLRAAGIELDGVLRWPGRPS